MPVYLAFSLLVTYIEVACGLFFLEAVFPPRLPGGLWLRSLGLAAAVYLLTLPAELIEGDAVATVALRASGMLLCFILWLLLAHRGSPGQKLMLAVLWVVLVSMADILVQLLAGVSGQEGEPFTLDGESVLLTLVSKAVLVVVVLLLRRLVNRSERGAAMDGPRWLVFLMLPVLTLISTSIMLQFYETAGEKRQVIVALCLGWLVMNVIAFLFLQRVERREQRWQDSRQMRRIASAEVKSLAAISKANERQRKLVHDFENHLLALDDMLAEGKLEKARSYLAAIGGTMRTEEERLHTGHKVVDTILNQKLGAAAAEGIEMVTTVSDLTGLTMADDDLVAILGNLLDNAIEACAKLAEGRVIALKLVLEDGESLVLSVKNPVAGEVRVEGGEVATSKLDEVHHGIGLQSVKEALSHYDATYAIQAEDGSFQFSAIVEL